MFSNAKKSAVLISLATAATAATAAGAEPAAPLDRFSFSAGGFYVKPEIMANGDTRYGRIESGNQKGDRTTLPRARADILFGDKHGLSFDYLRYGKSYNPTLSGGTVINGEPITGTASFDGKLKIDLSKVAYKWWLGEGNDVFGIGVGAAYYRAKLSGTATAQVNGTVGGIPQSRTVTGSDSTSDSAYAPVVDLAWRHAFSPEVRMVAEASGVKKNGGKINGHIYGGSIGVEWFALKNVGVVLAYGIEKIELHRNSDRNADLRIKLAGPSAHVKVRF